MTNAEIADVFDQVADLLEFQGANPFRIRAYRKGARAIRDLPERRPLMHQSSLNSPCGIVWRPVQRLNNSKDSLPIGEP